MYSPDIKSSPEISTLASAVVDQNIGAICLRVRVFCHQLKENGGFWKRYVVSAFKKISSVSVIPIADLSYRNDNGMSYFL